MAICPGKIVVFQICNENSAIDDNFNIYLNSNLLGLLDLNENAQIGAVFIGSTDPLLTITEPDFSCPMEGMDIYRFDDSIIEIGINTLEMINVETHDNGNLGTVGVRLYDLVGNNLVNPITIADLEYGGDTGESFTFEFEFTCDNTLTTTTTTPPISGDCVPCMPYVPSTPSGPPPIPIQTTIVGVNLNLTLSNTSPFTNLNTGITTTLPPFTTLPPSTTTSTTLLPTTPSIIICNTHCNILKF